MKSVPLIASLLLVSCASTTRINSNPPGAEVLVDGRVIGVTPAVFSEGSTWNWTQHSLTLRRPGYATFSSEIAASKIDVGRLIAGSLLCWPLLLATTDYPESYDFPLTPLPGSEERSLEATTDAPPSAH